MSFPELDITTANSIMIEAPQTTTTIMTTSSTTVPAEHFNQSYPVSRVMFDIKVTSGEKVCCNGDTTFYSYNYF